MKKKVVIPVVTCILLVVVIVGGILFYIFGNKNPIRLSRDQYKQIYSQVISTCDQYIQENAEPTVLLAVREPDDSDLENIENSAIDKNLFSQSLKSVCKFFINLLNNDTSNFSDSFSEGVSISRIQISITGYKTVETKFRYKAIYDRKRGTIQNFMFIEEGSYVYGDDKKTYQYYTNEIEYDFTENKVNKIKSIFYFSEEEDFEEAGFRLPLYYIYSSGVTKTLSKNSENYDNIYMSIRTIVLKEFEDLKSMKWSDNLPDYSTEYKDTL